jgi:hypothetical protein
MPLVFVVAVVLTMVLLRGALSTRGQVAPTGRGDFDSAGVDREVEGGAHSGIPEDDAQT